MPDVFTKAKRSEVMSRIRGKGNRDTELRLIQIFRAHKITGWRRNHTLYGKPDFVFRAGRVAVFVDGCFWHGCPKHHIKPRNNAAFWRKKIARNIERDKEVFRFLRKAGWRVLRVWEHELTRRNERRLVARLRRVLG
jgi:DNA mismatch endonuclease (patch repair protein)